MVCFSGLGEHHIHLRILRFESRLRHVTRIHDVGHLFVFKCVATKQNIRLLLGFIAPVFGCFCQFNIDLRFFNACSVEHFWAIIESHAKHP